MTREELGNFTYGYIGRALGFTFLELQVGSVAAAITGARSSNIRGQVANEVQDWVFIRKGFDAFDINRYTQ